MKLIFLLLSISLLWAEVSQAVPTQNSRNFDPKNRAMRGIGLDFPNEVLSIDTLTLQDREKMKEEKLEVLELEEEPSDGSITAERVPLQATRP